MMICCWTFGRDALQGEIDFAVKSAKRAGELAAKLRCGIVGSEIVLARGPLPVSSIRLWEGGPPFDGGQTSV